MLTNEYYQARSSPIVQSAFRTLEHEITLPCQNSSSDKTPTGLSWTNGNSNERNLSSRFIVEVPITIGSITMKGLWLRNTGEEKKQSIFWNPNSFIPVVTFHHPLDIRQKDFPSKFSKSIHLKQRSTNCSLTTKSKLMKTK